MRSTVLVSAPRQPRSLDWQCAVLEESCLSAFEEYRFVRLEEEHPRTEELGYTPINKLYSVLEWVRNHPVESNAERILICDPDIVFRSQVNIWPRQGSMVADEFSPGSPPAPVFPLQFVEELKEFLGLSFAPARFVQAHTGVMVFHPMDLPRVVSLAERIALQLLEFPLIGGAPRHRWQSEMYAWYLAAAELGMNVTTAPIAMCIDWNTRADAFSALHYCQPIYVRGKEVWNKHRSEAMTELCQLDPDQMERPADALLIEAVRRLRTKASGRLQKAFL